MKISIINGSPKLGKSTSALLIDYLTPMLEGNDIHIYHLHKEALNDCQLADIANSDTLIFAFPLYVDSLPSHLLRTLIDLAKQDFSKKKPIVYCIVNNGFYEGRQNHLAIEQMKIWCQHTHLTWGQAIGAGAGEMLPYISFVPLGHGPNKNLGQALTTLSQNIQSAQSGPDLFISPNYPRFLWKMNASMFVWHPRAKANGLKRKALYQQADKVNFHQ